MPDGFAEQLQQLRDFQRRGGRLGLLLAGQTQGPASLPSGFGQQPGFLTQAEQRERGARAGGLGARQGPVFGGRMIASPLARARLRKGQSLRSQHRQLFGGGGGARTLVRRGLTDPLARFQPGHGGFPGRRQIASFVGGGQRRPLDFGLLGSQQGPAAGGRFGMLGRPFGRLGQRRSPFWANYGRF